MADGLDCVTPSMDPSVMNVRQHRMSIEGEEEISEEKDDSVEEEDNGEEENIREYAYSQ